MVILRGGSVVSSNPNNTVANPASGIVGGSLDGVGSATVTSVGSTWQNLNGELHVGQSGHGNLLISAGGLVGTESFSGIRIGINATGVGEVMVTGTGSSMQTPRELDVGFSGNGRLPIEYNFVPLIAGAGGSWSWAALRVNPGLRLSRR